MTRSTVVVLIIFTFLNQIRCHTFDNYFNVLVNKFGSDGSVSKTQFEALALDVTSNKLHAAYPLDCTENIEGGQCIPNKTVECLGYDEIFTQYSNGNTLDAVSLGSAVSSLLYYAQKSNCIELHDPHKTRHKKPSTGEAWGYGIGFVTLIVIVSNIGALLAPCMKSQVFKRILMFCVALAVGTLGATGLLVLIPESLGITGIDSIIPDYTWKMTTVIGGIYFVFICERLLKMFIKGKKKETSDMEIDVKTPLDSKTEINANHENHGHSHAIPGGNDTSCGGVATVAWILLVGDAIHNFVDGLSIGAAFTENVFTGISVSLAVICEELPHELGDIAILLHSGLSMKRALLYNFLAAVLCYAGLVIGIVVGENTDANQWIFGFAGGLFVYIALVDMIPEMNAQATASEAEKTESTFQIFAYQNFGLLVGFAIIILISYYGKYIDV